MQHHFIGHTLVNLRATCRSIGEWSSRQQALYALAEVGRGARFGTHIEWTSPRSVSISDDCNVGSRVRLHADPAGDGRIGLGPKTVVSDNALLETRRGSITVGAGSVIEENVRICAKGGAITIGDGVTIGRDTEVSVDQGDVFIGDAARIDAGCMLRACRARVARPDDDRRSSICLGPRTVIGYGSILEANGGSIETRDDVKIDYRNIVGGSGGIVFDTKAHLRHSNYVDAFESAFYFGKHMTIGQKCIIAGRGPVTVGDESLIGGLTDIVSENHRINRHDKPYRGQGHVAEGVTIGRNVWIGAQCLIVDGVTVGEGTLIAGGAVVIKDLEPFSFAAGVPATRKSDMRER